MSDRWATFDCYGTLIDWNAGIGGQLGRLFGAGDADRLLARYHVIEPRVQRERPDAVGARIGIDVEPVFVAAIEAYRQRTGDVKRAQVDIERHARS